MQGLGASADAPRKIKNHGASACTRNWKKEIKLRFDQVIESENHS